jgi:hypothetical protein
MPVKYWQGSAALLLGQPGERRADHLGVAGQRSAPAQQLQPAALGPGQQQLELAALDRAGLLQLGPEPAPVGGSGLRVAAVAAARSRRILIRSLLSSPRLFRRERPRQRGPDSPGLASRRGKSAITFFVSPCSRQIKAALADGGYGVSFRHALVVLINEMLAEQGHPPGHDMEGC